MSNVQGLNHLIVSLQESDTTVRKTSGKYYQEKLARSNHSVKVLRKRRETVEGE